MAGIQEPKLQINSKKLKNKAIFDGRNMFSTELPSKHGFFYKSIGRKTVQSEK